MLELVVGQGTTCIASSSPAGPTPCDTANSHRPAPHSWLDELGNDLHYKRCNDKLRYTQPRSPFSPFNSPRRSGIGILIKLRTTSNCQSLASNPCCARATVYSSRKRLFAPSGLKHLPSLSHPNLSFVMLFRNAILFAAIIGCTVAAPTSFSVSFDCL